MGGGGGVIPIYEKSQPLRPTLQRQFNLHHHHHKKYIRPYFSSNQMLEFLTKMVELRYVYSNLIFLQIASYKGAALQCFLQVTLK